MIGMEIQGTEKIPAIFFKMRIYFLFVYMYVNLHEFMRITCL